MKLKRSSIDSILGIRRNSRRYLPTVKKGAALNSTTDSPVLVFDGVEDYALAKFLFRNNSTSIINKKTDINCGSSQLCDYLISAGFTVTHPTKRMFYAETADVFIDVDVKNWNVSVRVSGDVASVDRHIQALEANFTSNPCYVKYVYDPQYMEYTTLPINTDRQPMQEMYPWLDEPLESFYDRFVESTANILILTGIAGSGKTTLIRGMLSHTKQSAILAYHPKIIEQDSFFVQWIESDDMFMVLEDADNLITPRSDGNDIMSKFLNIGDGLMSFKGKKIVFSTNLPNISSIDSALTRGGRCFDILEFDYLNRADAQRLADKVNIPLGEGDKFTVSDVFSFARNEVKFARDNKDKKKFGFI